MTSAQRILVTGGTGYVGGRLIPLLQTRPKPLRLMVRRPEYLQSRVGDQHEIVAADVTDPDSLIDALQDVETAYYLIHSMGGGQGQRRDFEQQDRDAARNFAQAANANGVKRIIYLGGLGDETEELSKHLRSRQEVGHVLKESGAQVIEKLVEGVAVRSRVRRQHR